MASAEVEAANEDVVEDDAARAAPAVLVPANEENEVEVTAAVELAEASKVVLAVEEASSVLDDDEAMPAARLVLADEVEDMERTSSAAVTEVNWEEADVLASEVERSALDCEAKAVDELAVKD